MEGLTEAVEGRRRGKEQGEQVLGRGEGGLHVAIRKKAMKKKNKQYFEPTLKY